MDILSIINALFLVGWGLAFLIYVLCNWQNPVKQKVKYSELVSALLFFYAGYNLAILFPDPTPQSQKFLTIMLILYSGINIWLFFNIFPNYLKAKKDPQFAKDHSYEKFYEHLTGLHQTKSDAQKADLMKDISRKMLHFIQFSIIIGIHFYAINNTESLAESGMTEYDFRNYFYLIFGGFFFFMMLTGDLFRMTHFEYLPNWAFLWYTKSLEPGREKWTVNSSIPSLLANMLFMGNFVPIQVFFCATFISCISDAMTSIIGKNFGKHKLSQFGRYPNKTWEGLLGGTITSLIGVFVIFWIFPIGTYPLILGILCALVAAGAFVYIDAFSYILCDNILNSLIPGVLIWICLILFV